MVATVASSFFAIVRVDSGTCFWQQKLLAEIASRNCQQKLLVEIASKSCQQKLLACVEASYPESTPHQLDGIKNLLATFASKSRQHKLLAEIASNFCQQKLLVEIASKSCQQKLLACVESSYPEIAPQLSASNFRQHKLLAFFASNFVWDLGNAGKILLRERWGFRGSKKNMLVVQERENLVFVWPKIY